MVLFAGSVMAVGGEMDGQQAEKAIQEAEGKMEKFQSNVNYCNKRVCECESRMSQTEQEIRQIAEQLDQITGDRGSGAGVHEGGGLVHTCVSCENCEVYVRYMVSWKYREVKSLILAQNMFTSKASSAPVTTECQVAEKAVCETQVTVVDTPDFSDEDLQQADALRHY
ncbi:hypothetical protein ACEWY4_027459 [Coilia grayii]|uniref:AIG1-type G domain-containing protein n=1 Tax=Coilia grayii TaxID=363190 RepID=A0ABD1IPM0_9TELE